MKIVNDIIGVSANLAMRGSVHTTTFLRAIQLAEEHLCKGPAAVQIMRENDHASYEGGGNAARKLVDAAVRIVVGHYSSAAARGALDAYREAGIPLLLPAATADDLTTGPGQVFRLCNTDSDLAAFMVRALVSGDNRGGIYVGNDWSVHGQSLAVSLLRRLYGIGRVVGRPEEAEVIVFAGSYAASVEYYCRFRSSGGNCPIYLTDDAVHADLANDVGQYRNNLFCFGYAPADIYPAAKDINERYRQLFREEPGTYFLQTYAAMEIAVAWLKAGYTPRITENGCPAAAVVCETVLGPIRFEKGESHSSRFSLWELPENGALRVAQQSMLC